MTAWQPTTLAEARRMAWDQDDWNTGVKHCTDIINMELGLAYLPDRATVADFGCGPGRLTIPLALCWPHLDFVGVDSSMRMIAAGADRELPNLRWHYGSIADAAQVAFGMDAAFSVLTFQHMTPDDQQAALAVTHQRLLPGGRFLLQWVTEGDEGPLNHPVSLYQMGEWVGRLRFRVSDVWEDEVYPTWWWLALRKRFA